MIKSEDGKHCLYSKDGSKKLGCFKTEAEAKEHERRIQAMVAMRQSAIGTVSQEDLRRAGIAWQLEHATGIDELLGSEEFQFAAAFGEFEKLFAKPLRQESYSINTADKQGIEWDVCIIEEGWSKPSEGMPPVNWSQAVLSDPDLHKKLENAHVRIYRLADGSFNHAPLEVISSSANKLTGNTAGVLSDVRYGEFTRPDGQKASGVLGRLHVTMSSVSSLMKKSWELGKQILGLSVDTSILMDYVNNAVARVNEVKEVTLVNNPAAGGWPLALRASAQPHEVQPMDKLKAWLEANRPDLLKKLEAAKDEEYEKLLLEAFETKKATETAPVSDTKPAEPVKPAEPEAPKAPAEVLPTVVETKEFVEAALQQAAGLEDVAKKVIREEYEGRQAKPVQVMKSIARMQALASSMTKPPAPLTVKTDDSVTNIKAEQDKYNDAMMGLWTGQDVNKTPRFTSLRQSYHEIAKVNGWMSNADLGRRMFNEVPYGLAPLGMSENAWFDRLRLKRESEAYGDANLRQSLLQTTSWTVAFGNTLHRFLLSVYNSPDLQEWRKIVSRFDNVQDFKAQTFTRVGGYSNLPTVSEGSTYETATHPAEESINYTLVKRGELAFFTWEAFVNDDIGAIKQVPQKIMRAAAQTKYEFFFDLLRSPGNYDGDSVALFHASHGNLSSTALSQAALDAIILAMRDQTELTSAKPISVVPRYVVIPNELDRTTFEAVKDALSSYSGRTETLQNWLKQFQLEGIRVPYWTDATDYCVIGDPTVHDTIAAGHLDGRQEPEMWFADRPDSYHMFNSDKIALKIRDIYSGDYLDFRTMHKAVVA